MKRLYPFWARIFVGIVLCGGVLPAVAAGTPPEIPYDFTRQRLFPGFDGRLCKIQPTLAMDGKGTALLAYQRLLLSGSDVFYGQFMSKSTDGGQTWSEPVELTALKDTHEDGYRVARYATVRYSAANAKWFALGMAQLYLDDKRPFQKYVNGRPYGTPLYVSATSAWRSSGANRGWSRPSGCSLAVVKDMAPTIRFGS